MWKNEIKYKFIFWYLGRAAFSASKICTKILDSERGEIIHIMRQ
jgi:hypothetical protein